MTNKIPSDMIKDRSTGVTVAQQLAEKTTDIEKLKKKTDGFISVAEYDNLKVAVAGGYDYAPCIQKACDDAVINGMLKVVLPTNYTVATTVNIPSGLHLEGFVGSNGQGVEVKRIADIVAFKAEGVSVTLGTNYHFNTFRYIKFHGNAANNYTSDFMQLYYCGVVIMSNCSFYSMKSAQLHGIELMDSRFIDCWFDWGGSEDGTKAAVILESGAGAQYSNQVHFRGCRFESYRGTAIEFVGSNVNEIYISDTKFESLQSQKPHLKLNNAAAISLKGVNICSKGSQHPKWKESTNYINGQFVTTSGNEYKAITSGTSGTVAPSHTSGTATDGTVTWEYVGSLPTISSIVQIQNTSHVYGDLWLEHTQTIGDNAARLTTFVDIVNSQGINLHVNVYQNGNNVEGSSIVTVDPTSDKGSIRVTGSIKSDNGSKDLSNIFTSGIRAYQGTTQTQAIPATTYTKVQFPTEEFDELGEYSTTFSTFTAKKTGFYYVQGSVRVGNVDGNRLILLAYKNGNAKNTLCDMVVGAAKDSAATGSTMLKLNKGETVSLYLWSENATNTVASFATQTYMTVSKIQ